MKSDAGPSIPSESPFNDLSLSLDPTTIGLALGAIPVKFIDLDGTVVYDEGPTPESQLSKQLDRIFNEIPYGMSEVTESKLEKLPSNDPAVKLAVQDQAKEEEYKRDPFEMMKIEEMEALRMEMWSMLNEARNQLYWGLETAKTLSLSASFPIQPPPPPTALHQKKLKAKPPQPTPSSLTAIADVPPIIPPGTYTTTPGDKPSKALHAQVFELEQLLSAKQKALDDSQGLIDNAVEELTLMAEAGERFWKDVRVLKEGKGGRGQWAVVPKPDFGRSVGPVENAKDVIIPYAIDEAPGGTRVRCLAGFDLDPTKTDALTFGARHHMRLRVILQEDGGASHSSTPAEMEDESDVRALMEAAQMEAFDHDLFHEIRYEVSKFPRHDMENDSVSLSIAKYNLAFQLYDPKSTASTLPVSPLCDLILSSASLNLLNAHRQRKTNLVAPTMTEAGTAASSNLSTGPYILKTIVDALRTGNPRRMGEATVEAV